MSSILIDVAIALGLGLAGGVLAGMFGIGGGIIFVPSMVLILGQEQHIAQGISIFAVTAAATAGAITHYRQNTLRLKQALWIAPAAVVFAALGAWLAGLIDAVILGRIFGALLLFVGVRMIFGRSRERDDTSRAE